MGGTGFLGKSIVDEALHRGWDVTTFNRGRSGRDVPGVRAVHGDRTEVADLTGKREAPQFQHEPLGPDDPPREVPGLIVSPRLDFARDISDQIPMFDSGQVIESGSPEKIFGDPEHERTREFLGAVL